MVLTLDNHTGSILYEPSDMGVQFALINKVSDFNLSEIHSLWTYSEKFKGKQVKNSSLKLRSNKILVLILAKTIELTKILSQLATLVSVRLKVSKEY